MKAHVCIGGPLDGQFATSDDFYGNYPYEPGTRRRDYRAAPNEGMYEHLKDEYFQFNTAARVATRNHAHVVWLHKSLLKPAISPKDR